MVKHNEIKDSTIPLIGSYNYENMFNVYIDDDDMYYYNVLRNLHFPTDIAPTLFTVISPLPGELLPQLSYRLYKVVNLWWMIAGVNDIKNPLDPLNGDDKIKVVSSAVIQNIISRMREE